MEEKQQIEKKLGFLFPNEQITLLRDAGMSFAYEVGKYIVRIPKTEVATNGYRKEETLLRFLQNIIKSVAIPNIKVIETPFIYSIHKKLEGSYWNGSDYNKKTDKEKDLLANDCATFFVELHSANKNDFEIQVDDIRPIKQDVEIYLSSEFFQKEIDKILKKTDILFSLQDKLLIHNDFYDDNFFVDNNYRLQSVIDFANARYCNYNFEFRKIVSYQEGEKDFWERIIRHYENMTGRKIDVEIIKIIDIYNYMDFLSYHAKNYKIKTEKNQLFDRWDYHIQYVKSKIKSW